LSLQCNFRNTQVNSLAHQPPQIARANGIDITRAMTRAPSRCVDRGYA
jgi:hypothetical protein